MDDANIITTPLGEEEQTPQPPLGWQISRIETDIPNEKASYVTWNPDAVEGAVFLTVPTPELAAGLRAEGFSPLRSAGWHRTRVWLRPASLAATAAA